MKEFLTMITPRELILYAKPYLYSYSIKPLQSGNDYILISSHMLLTEIIKKSPPSS